MNLFIKAALLMAANQTSGPMTIDDAVNIALRNAFSVRSAEVQALKAEEQVKSAKGAIGPSIGVNGTYQHLSSSGSTFAFPGQVNTYDTKQVQVSLTQQVDISGIARAALRAAEFQRNALRAGLEAEQNLVKQVVRTKYISVLQSQEMVTVAEADVAAATERLQKTEVRFREGAVPEFDVLRLKTDLRRAEQILVDARQNLTLAKQDLNNTLGRPVDTEFEVVVVSQLPGIEKAPEEYGYAAQVSRAEVEQGELNIKALEKVRDTETRGSKPSLALSAVHTQNIDPPATQSKETTIGQAVISFPVFDSGITKARVRAAERDIESAKILLEQIQLGIALEVRSAITRVLSARESYEVALEGETLARESLRLAQLRYDEGVGLLIDVTTAQAEMTRASAAVVNAKYQYLSAYAALQKAVGMDRLDVLPEKPAEPAGEKEEK